jgi:hypothetical protein
MSPNKMVTVNHPTFLTLFKESENTCAQHSQVLLTYNQITKYKGERAITGGAICLLADCCSHIDIAGKLRSLALHNTH